MRELERSRSQKMIYVLLYALHEIARMNLPVFLTNMKFLSIEKNLLIWVTTLLLVKYIDADTDTELATSATC